MSITAIVGEHPAGPVQELLVLESWRDYVAVFGSTPTRTWLTDAVRGFFANGGSTAVVCNPGEPSHEEDRAARYAESLLLLEALPEIGLICAPGRAEEALQDAVLAHCERMRTRLALLDGPPELESGGVQRLRRPRDSAFGACYFPWIAVTDAEWGPRRAPCSGHVAGLYARFEREHGLHAPPANEILRGATGARHPVSRMEEEFLTSRHINCVRDLGERGLRVFGTRTLAGGAVTVRRVAAMIERVLGRLALMETQQAAPDPAARLEASARAFLLTQWQAGALSGAFPEESFSVHCEQGDSLRCTARFRPRGSEDLIPVQITVPLPAIAIELAGRAG